VLWLQVLSGEMGTVEGVLHLFDALHDGPVVLAIEGRAAGDQDVEDDACRPNVASLVVIKFEHFWRDVVRSADKFVLGLLD